MRYYRPLAILCTLLIGAGCWSVGLRAEQNAAQTPGKVAGPGETNAEANTMTQSNAGKGFLENLPKDFQMPDTDAGRLLLREYGAVYLARGGAVPPKKVVFENEADVQAFQTGLKVSSETIGGLKVELQTVALKGLDDAIAEAKKAKLTISPRGADSARRGYDQTVSLWASRVNPGLVFWVGKGRMTAADAKRIKAMSPFEQVPEILTLEKDGIFFAKDLSKSIIFSVAPPGTSQHLSMLALDVKEFENAQVRAILGRHGWFQTVSSDLPHFTYLGVKESDLTSLGLKQVRNSDRVFWVPDLRQ